MQAEITRRGLLGGIAAAITASFIPQIIAPASEVTEALPAGWHALTDAQISRIYTWHAAEREAVVWENVTAQYAA